MHMEAIIIFPCLISPWTFSKAQLKYRFQRSSQTNLVQILTPPPICCVTLNKWFDFIRPQFLLLPMGGS